MLAWFALLLIIALVLGLGAAIGAPWLALIPVVLAIGAFVWLIAAGLSKKPVHVHIRETPEADLFGPGKEDDSTSEQPVRR